MRQYAAEREAALAQAGLAQTITTVAFEVQAGCAGPLEAAIIKFRLGQEAAGVPYDHLRKAVPTLHFMSIMVFRDETYDPLFLLEANFDGGPGAFWASLVQAAGEEIIAMLRFCAPPQTDAAKGRFNTALATGKGLAAVLQEASVTPTASHLGNRGLTRTQILDEAELFTAVQSEINASDAAYRAKRPAEIHQALHSSLSPGFPWLQQPSPPRISAAENRADFGHILLFAGVVLAVLAVPGAIVALVLPWWFAAGLGVVAALVLWQYVPGLSQLVRTSVAQGIVVAGIAILTLVFAAGWLLVAALALYVLASLAALIQHGELPVLAQWMIGAVFAILAGAATAPAVVLAVLAWVRRLEQRDSTSTAPVLTEADGRLLSAREDQTSEIFQNHMGSIVMVKPGGLRSLLLRVGHRALHLVLRLVARDGYLSDMRTVHFAHWALLNNNSRLLFMSNFDGTWSSYLDDFIEKAHQGTTLAWTNCVGAPPTKFLVLDGVTNGRQFKQWARCSMAPNLFWFSAYPRLTVNQIGRNHIVAEGLRKRELDAGSAAQWVRSL